MFLNQNLSLRSELANKMHQTTKMLHLAKFLALLQVVVLMTQMVQRMVLVVASKKLILKIHKRKTVIRKMVVKRIKMQKLESFQRKIRKVVLRAV